MMDVIVIIPGLVMKTAEKEFLFLHSQRVV